MGSGGSNGAAGGSLGGGKTVVAGTFLAEQTHSSPASYTLVSVGASTDRRKIPSGSGGSNRGDRLRKSRTEKGGPQCTKLSALDDYDTLLLPDDEEAPSPAQRKAPQLSPSLKTKAAGQKASPSRAKMIVTGPAATTVQPEASALALERPQSKGSQQKIQSPVHDVKGENSSSSPRPNSLKAPPLGRGRPHSQPSAFRATSSASNMSGCSERLYVAQKPWVAGESDADLLQYLADRGGSPEIASPPRTADSSFHASSLSSQSRSCRRQYRNHRDLFDSCLHRDASPSPPPRQISPERSSRFATEGSKMTEQSSTRSVSRPIYSPQRQIHSARSEDRIRLFDQIETINVIALPEHCAQGFIPSSPSKADVHAYAALLANIEQRDIQDQPKNTKP